MHHQLPPGFRLRRRGLVLRALPMLALSLISAACTGDYSTTPTTLAHPPTSGPSATPPGSGAEDVEPETPGDQDLVVELGGTLAVTVEHLVVTASPDGSQVDLVDGGPDGIASQPVWSPDGSSLAWVFVGPDRESVGVRWEDGEAIYSPAAGSAPFYLQWNSSGQRLAYLRPEPLPAAGEAEEPVPGDGAAPQNEGGLEAGLIEPGVAVSPIALGAPFFLSWAPDRDELIAYRNQNELLYLSQEAGALVLPAGEGPYTAPVWLTPESVIVSDADSIDELNIETGERRELASVAGRVRFVLSPNGERLAYSSAADGVLPGEKDQLIVLDIESGGEQVVSEGFLLAWEWSPDSETLAWLAPSRIAEVDLVAYQRTHFSWSFWNDGEIEVGAAYLPSGLDSRAYLPFFEQFAQSHKRWSPGSNAFAFAGSVDGFDGIWIQVVGHAGEPVYLTPGDAVTWGPADPTGGGGSVL